MIGVSLANAAVALSGTPFRLHGREPATGLDCIGVLYAAMSAIGKAALLPRGYRLRSIGDQHLDEWAQKSGFIKAGSGIRPGDVQMVRCTPCQLHLVIRVDGLSFVHAHARLKRVVLDPGPLNWPVVGHWRLEDRI